VELGRLGYDVVILDISQSYLYQKCLFLYPGRVWDCALFEVKNTHIPHGVWNCVLFLVKLSRLGYDVVIPDIYPLYLYWKCLPSYPMGYEIVSYYYTLCIMCMMLGWCGLLSKKLKNREEVMDCSQKVGNFSDQRLFVFIDLSVAVLYKRNTLLRYDLYQMLCITIKRSISQLIQLNWLFWLVQ
jgi:hypothetical protein